MSGIAAPLRGFKTQRKVGLMFYLEGTCDASGRDPALAIRVEDKRSAAPGVDRNPWDDVVVEVGGRVIRRVEVTDSKTPTKDRYKMDSLRKQAEFARNNATENFTVIRAETPQAVTAINNVFAGIDNVTIDVLGQLDARIDRRLDEILSAHLANPSDASTWKRELRRACKATFDTAFDDTGSSSVTHIAIADHAHGERRDVVSTLLQHRFSSKIPLNFILHVHDATRSPPRLAEDVHMPILGCGRKWLDARGNFALITGRSRRTLVEYPSTSEFDSALSLCDGELVPAIWALELAVKEFWKVVITGPGGAGKTELLHDFVSHANRMGADAAYQFESAPADHQASEPCAVYLQWKDLVARGSKKGTTDGPHALMNLVLDAALGNLSGLAGPRDDLRRMIDDGKCVLCIDAVDEVAADHGLLDVLTALGTTWPRAKVVCGVRSPQTQCGIAEEFSDWKALEVGQITEQWLKAYSIKVDSTSPGTGSQLLGLWKEGLTTGAEIWPLHPQPYVESTSRTVFEVDICRRYLLHSGGTAGTPNHARLLEWLGGRSDWRNRNRTTTDGRGLLKPLLQLAQEVYGSEIRRAGPASVRNRHVASLLDTGIVTVESPGDAPYFYWLNPLLAAAWRARALGALRTERDTLSFLAAGPAGWDAAPAAPSFRPEHVATLLKVNGLSNVCAALSLLRHPASFIGEGWEIGKRTRRILENADLAPHLRRVVLTYWGLLLRDRPELGMADSPLVAEDNGRLVEELSWISVPGKPTVKVGALLVTNREFDAWIEQDENSSKLSMENRHIRHKKAFVLPNQPATGISEKAAESYVAWRNRQHDRSREVYRLVMQDEWEALAREYSPDTPADIRRGKRDSHDGPMPVGSWPQQPPPYDLIGCVAELVSGPPATYCGGSWLDDEPVRTWGHRRKDHFGFRLAREEVTNGR